jgi:ATP-dependent Clp protease ATP-binding subunit ClpB
VIIMTSNLGSQRVHGYDGDYQSMKALVMESVTEHFRPEFINRVDDIVVFHALGEEQVRAIANIQMDILRKRLNEQDITLDINSEALDMVGRAGFDPVYGARPLKRSIQDLIENPLADAILSGDFKGGDVVVVTVTDGSLSFQKAIEH